MTRLRPMVSLLCLDCFRRWCKAVLPGYLVMYVLLCHAPDFVLWLISSYFSMWYFHKEWLHRSALHLHICFKYIDFYLTGSFLLVNAKTSKKGGSGLPKKANHIISLDITMTILNFFLQTKRSFIMEKKPTTFFWKVFISLLPSLK